jgi:hypothetical protein
MSSEDQIPEDLKKQNEKVRARGYLDVWREHTAPSSHDA